VTAVVPLVILVRRLAQLFNRPSASFDPKSVSVRSASRAASRTYVARSTHSWLKTVLGPDRYRWEIVDTLVGRLDTPTLGGQAE
jgi:hypothetical protein